jgi:hypothetical protein
MRRLSEAQMVRCGSHRRICRQSVRKGVSSPRNPNGSSPRFLAPRGPGFFIAPENFLCPNCQGGVGVKTSVGVFVFMKSFFLVLALLFISIPTMKSDEKPNFDISTSSGFRHICGALDKSESETNQAEKYGNVYCLAWIEGLFRGISVSEVMHNVLPNNRIACPPAGVDYYQIAHILRKYINDHPELEHNPTEGLAVLALQNAFQCK